MSFISRENKTERDAHIADKTDSFKTNHKQSSIRHL